MRKTFVGAALAALLMIGHTETQAFNEKITWDALSLMMDGRRVVPVMGEIHYSRLPAEEWAEEVRKMKEGGVTVIATYVFWNHVEEIQGQFDWSGQRDLRRFLEVCKQEGMPVVLRLGPFCHGEARNGGMPDWAVNLSRQAATDGQKPMRLRSEDPRWLDLTARLYRQIFTQVQGLQWKDGGPVMAAQFDNEYRGRGSYLMALKKIALEVGFDLPFYTRTGWPELATPVPFGEMLPLYGDYADGFWERSTAETVGNYWKAFFFKEDRDNKSIGSEQLNYDESNPAALPQQYPFFTCELGGGMATAYHRRPYIYPADALAMAIVKLGSGSNLLGYYMYHGGTNPKHKLTYLNENQATPVTNYNDMPLLSYEFQAPLGEFGQKHDVYYRLRPLHLFLEDYGEQLAPMTTTYTDGYTNGGHTTDAMKKGDDSRLRWSCRTSPDGKSGFIFFNNYERLQQLSAKRKVKLSLGSVQLPAINIPAGAMGVLPVGVEGMRYATAQLVARRDDKVYLMQIPGMPANIVFADGKKLSNAKARGAQQPIYKNYYLLSQAEAEHLFLAPEPAVKVEAVAYEKTRDAQGTHTIRKGIQKVAAMPTLADFLQHAAVYKLNITDTSSGLLEINYHGDCARLYVDGMLVADNFNMGLPFAYDLKRIPKDKQGHVRSIELHILPMQKDAPIYYPREVDTTPGEGVVSIVVKN